MERTYKRAITLEEKKEIVDRLLALWTRDKEMSDLRLGQMIWNVTQGGDFFYIEDYDFIKLIEEYYKD